MPDISLCENFHNCKKALKCFRFMAKPGQWQSYSDFYPDKNNNCEYYWPLKEATAPIRKLTKAQLKELSER